MDKRTSMGVLGDLNKYTQYQAAEAMREAASTPNSSAGAGMGITPIAFLVIKDGSVRMIPVAVPANTTADRLVEMVPDTLDKIANFVDSHLPKKEE